MWHTPIIPAFRRLGQADFEFKASLSYIAWPCLKTKTNNKKRGGYKYGKEEHMGEHCISLEWKDLRRKSWFLGWMDGWVGGLMDGQMIDDR
jgi:hypothetical protein